MAENEQSFPRGVLAFARVGYTKLGGLISEKIRDWQAARPQVTAGEIKNIAPVELSNMLSAGDHPLVVDVREPWEYAQGHVPGAVLIPLGNLRAQLGQLDPKHPVAIICAHGNRSRSAAALLRKQGFEKIYNVAGGTAAWARAGLPLSRKKHTR